MEEKSRNPLLVVLKATHKRMDFVGDIFFRVRQISRVDIQLERVIQIFIRVAFRRIRRQKKDFH